MPLNEFGKIGAAEIAFYIPIVCIAFYVVLKHGCNRQQGWFFLALFSIVRLLGAIVTVDAQQQKSPSIGLFTAAAILQGIGLSPLLMATLRFVFEIARYGQNFRYARILHLVHLILIIGLVMGILGGTKSSPVKSANTISEGRTLARVASVLFFASLVLLFGIHTLLWNESTRIPHNHRKLLCAISASIPFLLIRAIYGLLNSFSSTSHNRWSPSSGTWWIYLVMGVITEYIVVSVYAITGALSPLDQDHPPPEQDPSASKFIWTRRFS